jgi:peptide chain release factor subunit 1
MEKNIRDFIRELSDIYDKNSNDTFVSYYANKDRNENFFKKRVRACELILKKEELKNFKLTIEFIEASLKKFQWNHIAVFASKKYNFLKYFKLPMKLNDSLIVDSSPYLRPLARILDEWESFTLLMINSNSAKIFSITLGQIDEIKNLSSDIMNKHKKGGWSQARFNRLRRGAINSFFSEVIEALEKRQDKQIIIAGPGEAKKQFIDNLSKNIKDKIIAIIDVDISDEQELMKRSLQLIKIKEERDSSEAVQQLKQEILKDGLAAYGIDETLKAVKNGQVELLIIEKDYKSQGWICENCQLVKEGKTKICPYCNGNISEVDVIEEILEFAERTDAEIEFTDDEEISNIGHIGAILRYK